MKNRRRIFVRAIVLCTALVSWGCLDQDRAHESETGGTEQGPVEDDAICVGTVPREIDPGILRSRAFQESPLLWERFSNGQLPPISERLPMNWLVVVPLEEIGTQGGTISERERGQAI